MKTLRIYAEQTEIIDLVRAWSFEVTPSLSGDMGTSDLVFGASSLRTESLNQGLPFVLVEPRLSAAENKKSRLLHRDFGVLDLSLPKENLRLVIDGILRLAHRRHELHREKVKLISSNQELRARAEKEIDRREGIKEGKINESLALKQAGVSLRKRIFFFKSLNEAVEINDVIQMIQEESRKIKGLADPILVIERSNECLIFYTSGRQVISKRISVSLPEGGREWRQSLANHLNRPIGPLIRLEGLKSKISLFFEHQLGEFALRDIQAEWQLRMVGVELVIDRFQLARDLSEAALFWEKTFDGLGEPIGIFDGENNVIRANHLFTPDLMGRLDEKVIRDGSQVFHVESYDILMGREIAEGSKVIYLNDQSSSFQLKQHMIQTEKIAALGQLAGHIAHELNNPLTGIRSLCQVLLGDQSLSQQEKEDIAEVEAAALRCQNIIRNLLDYSKPHREDMRIISDVNQVVSNTLPLLKSLMGRHRSEVSLSSEPLMASVDPHMLQQVVFNLVVNACQAMEEKGSVTIATSCDNNSIKIRVQDTGPGVPAELQEEVFEPFFTTKPVGEGTGLGLSLSLNIIRGFGGDIKLDKFYKDGAAFEIILPRCEP